MSEHATPAEGPRFFTFEHEGPQATIAFNRPEKRNCVDASVMLEFESLVERARDLPEVKVLVVTGNGPVFCAGADMTLGRDAASKAEQAAAQAELNAVPRLIGRVYDTMLHADLITVGAINGHAVGGGWSLALGFDHVIAADGADFWLPEVEIGMAFRGLAGINLVHRLGPVLAKEAMILGRRFSAAELRDLRLVNAVCAREDLAAHTADAVEAYLSVPWKAAITTRRGIHDSLYGPQLY
ncbi:MAG: enoyl-CoA hydratase/isomerase family protein [Actinomycetota bacterium]